MTDSDDRSALDEVPFVRHGPPDELWPRIAAAAGAAHRRQLAHTWVLRVGLMAAGLVIWLLADAILRGTPTTSGPRETLARDDRAWLWESTDELPPEAQLVTSLVAREGQR